MRKFFLLSLLLPLLASCFKSRIEYTPGQGDIVIEDKYHITKSYEVPVLGDGTVTQVVYHRADGDSEILATTDIPVTIQIPAWLEATESQNGAISNHAPASGEWIEVIKLSTPPEGHVPNTFIKDGNSVLMFEDSRIGDFDYNDLVLYVRHSIRGTGTVANPATITIRVKPIALGSVNNIAFGWEDGNGEHLLSDNVRRDFFFDPYDFYAPGSKGFVNTYPVTKPYADYPYGTKPFEEPIPVVDDGSGNIVTDAYTIFRDRNTMERARNYENTALDMIVGGYFEYKPVPTTCSSSSNDTKTIKYFIKTSGSKYYVASIDKSLPENTYPYGLAIPVAYHPYEGVPIEEAYPGFKSWIETGAPLNWSSNSVSSRIYTAHVNYARW